MASNVFGSGRTWAIVGMGAVLAAAPLGCDRKSSPTATAEAPAVGTAAGAPTLATTGAEGAQKNAHNGPAASAAADQGGFGTASPIARRGEGDGSPGALAPRDFDAKSKGALGTMAGGGALPPSSPAKPMGNNGAPAPVVDAPVVRRGEVAIDPNGRFATTYRPGGGHLAAFESAVSRGIVPGSERALVADVAARYVPDFAVPAGKALAVQTDLERTALPPSGGPEHLRIALHGSAVHAKARPHLSVHLVLDVSGSMAGESIENARRAAAALVDKLDAGDDFSLTTFSSDANLAVADGPVGARREAIKHTIAGIHEGGGTNISAGLSIAYKEAAKPAIPVDAMRVVLLLSDGHANAGITDSNRLSKIALDAFQTGVQTSTFGLGPDYDGSLMSAIADDGAGGYYYLRDAAQIAPALATELDKRLDPVATAVEVRVRLKPGVELLHVYGSRRLTDAEAQRVRTQEVAADAQAQKKEGIAKDRDDDREGGMRFFIPAFARDDDHALLLKLRVPEGAGKRDLALVEVKYKDRLGRTNAVEEVPVGATYANSDAESAASASGSMLRSVQGFAAGESLTAASEKIAAGDREGASAILGEREGLLRQAATSLSEPLFLQDADRMARLRSFTSTTQDLGEPLVLAMLLETAGRSHLH